MSGSNHSEGSFSLEVSNRAPGQWPDLLARDPEAEYTHSRYWTQAVCDHLPAAEEVWLTVFRSGDLVGGLNAVGRPSSETNLPLATGRWRLDSSFEGTSGGPVIAADLDEDDRDRIFDLLVAALGASRRGVLGSCALVLGPAQEKRFGGLLPPGSGWVRLDAPTAVVSLSGGIDQVDKQRLVMNKRNERNRGLRRGAEVFATDDPALLQEYYEIYVQAAGHWGIDPVPLSLLQALLADPDHRVFFTCVRLEGKVIGGHLCLHRGQKVLAWNGVTDPRYARTHFPATLCFWGDMVEACRRNAAWLDLGGSGSVGTLAGFKKYFGAELQMRGLYVRDSSLTRILRKGRDLWRGMRAGSLSQRWHDAAKDAGKGEQS